MNVKLNFQKSVLFLAFLTIVKLSIAGQVEKIVPPFWYDGFEDDKLQIILYGNDIASASLKIKGDVLELQDIEKVENDNYLVLNTKVKQSGTAEIVIKGNSKESIKYEIRDRNNDPDHIRGLNSSDFMYLIMPDRFSNADPSNDKIAGMVEQTLNRDSMFHRHGGDLKGIENHLDYLEELNVTALWINPVLENDQDYWSYHGYAATDYYNVDARFGGNEAYFSLINAMKKRGMKIVKDIIHNHWGTYHWMMKDLPSKDFIHQWDTFTRTTYRAPVHFDPYVSNKDQKQMLDGWFHPTMPDLNQDNPIVANYLIQNNIWWIETAGIDAFRLDTYAYSSPAFLELWSERVFKEFPNFTAFGETWVHGSATQAFFHGGSILNKAFNSELHGLTDFQLYYAITDALTKDHGWTDGVNRIYYTLAKDYLYADPMGNVLFLDNHDLSRFYSVIGEDMSKFKSGVTFLMTMRGIPMIYYGTEVLMKNFADPDGLVREDFPGGWEGDSESKFFRGGRTMEEQKAFEFIARLSKYRSESEALQNGKMTHFIPEDNTYVYFRTADSKTVMVAFNFNKEGRVIDLDRFEEMINGKERAINVITGKPKVLSEGLKLGPYESMILEF